VRLLHQEGDIKFHRLPEEDGDIVVEREPPGHYYRQIISSR
jgi:hypothetical protein